MRGLRKQLVPIPLGVGGVDTRTESKALSPPKLHTLSNGVFTTPSSMRKRYGGAQIASQEWDHFSAAATAVAGARLAAAFEDELLVGDGEALMSYANGYLTTRGYLTPFQVRSETLRPMPRVYNTDSASTGSFTVHAWEFFHASGVCAVFYQATDDTTGVVLGAGSLAYHAANSYWRPAVVAVGSSIHVYYVDDAADDLLLAVFTRSGAGLGISNSISVCTDMHATVPVFDVRKAGTQVLVVYNSSTATTVKHGYVTEAGVVGAFTDRTTAAAVSALGCAVDDSTLGYALFWAMNSTTTVTAGLFNSNASQLVAPTTLGTTYTSSTFIDITGAIVSGATSTLHVLIGIQTGATIFHATLTSAGAAVDGVRWYRDSYLASHAWVHGGYVFCAFSGGSLSDGLARRNAFVGRCATTPDTSPGIVPDSSANGRPLEPRSWDRYIVAGGFLPLVSHPNDDWGVLAHVSTLTGPKYRFSLVYAADGSGGYAIKQIDLDTTATAPFLVAGQCAHMPSAQGLTQYDGRYVTETGFWMYPPDPTSSLIAGTNLEASANYGYRVYYEWLNWRGERERSAAAEITVTTTSDRQVRLVIKPLIQTNKTCELGIGDVAIVVYRTLGGETDAYYRVTNTDPGDTSGANCYIRNDTTVASITWDDDMPDALAATKEQDYISAGELEEVAPWPARVATTGNGRVFLAGLDDPNLVRYSKTRGTGEALTFNEALEVFVDAGVGPITGLAMLADTLIVFRETSTFAIVGDGFNNTGTESTLGPPQVLSEEIGCIGQRSIVRVPAGVLFQSKKGFYLLTKDGALLYIGADVESYNAQTVLAAVAMPDSEEVRFTMSGGATLLYDFAAGQWSTWTIGGLDACVWRNSYVRLVDATGSIYQENTGYVDGSTTYSMVARTAWIKLAALQGYQRVYRAKALGEFRAGHKIRVKVRIDYNETVVQTLTWDATTYNDDGTNIYQFEIPLKYQKCQAVSFEFEDIVDDVPTALRESYRLSELLLEVGMKRGTFKDAGYRKAIQS
jgi:hypothetical protein